MAGHSKWHNIQRRKGAQDAKRGKIFMYHAKNIYTAAKSEGDPDMNLGLRLAIEKAKADNMPIDNIYRASKKATGTLDDVRFEEVTYECYETRCIAVIVSDLTVNEKGDNLGENVCVAFMFDRTGCIIILNEDRKRDEDELTLTAIEAGAEDIEYEEGVFEINTNPDDFNEVIKVLKDKGYEIESSEITLVPQTYIKASEDDQEKMEHLIEMLEDSEDVQDIHHNMEESV